MFTARTQAEKALAVMLPAGADPKTLIEDACHLVFLSRDRVMQDDLATMVADDPDRAVGLLVTLAAFVDADRSPDEMIAWLGGNRGRDQETARTIGALEEARAEYAAEAADTLPEVTFESMREMIHLAKMSDVVQPCGTPAAHARHLKRKQRPCPRCVKARQIYDDLTGEQRELLRTPITKADHFVRCLCHYKKSQKRPNCGEPGGYNSHKARGEDPCIPCRKARSEYDARRHAERLAAEGRAPARAVRKWADVDLNALPDEPVKVPATVGAEIQPLPAA